MSFIEAMIMGLIQGLTEFLPVSSSGHLAIFKNIFHVNTDTGLLYDVLLHLATLIAICFVYWQDIYELLSNTMNMICSIGKNAILFFKSIGKKEKREYIKVIDTPYKRFVCMILLSTIPTGILGVLFEKVIGSASEHLLLPGICLIGTSVILFISHRLQPGNITQENATYKQAAIIGICQGIATLPGISRSGTTITACLANGFSREFAVKYSFIMSIPAILGAMVLELKDFHEIELGGTMLINYLAGMIVAGVVGYICIKFMLFIVKEKSFIGFSIYCLIAGVLSLLYYFVMA